MIDTNKNIQRRHSTTHIRTCKMTDVANISGLDLDQFITESESNPKITNNFVHFAALQSTVAMYKLAEKFEQHSHPDGRPKGNQGRKKRDPSQSCNVFIEFYTPQQHAIRTRVKGENDESHEYFKYAKPIAKDGEAFVNLIAAKYNKDKARISAEYLKSEVFTKKPASVKNKFILKMRGEYPKTKDFRIDLFDEDEPEDELEEELEEEEEEGAVEEEEEGAVEDVPKEEQQQQQPAVRAKKGKRKTPASTGQRGAPQSPKTARLSSGRGRPTGLVKKSTPQKKAPSKADEHTDENQHRYIFQQTHPDTNMPMQNHIEWWTPVRHTVYQHHVDRLGGPRKVTPKSLLDDMGPEIEKKFLFTYEKLQSYLQRDREKKLEKRRKRYAAFAASPVAPQDPARAQPVVAPPVPASAQPQVAAAAEAPRAGPSREPGNHEARGEPPDPETPEDTEPAAAAATTSPPSVPRKKQHVAPAQGAEAANDGFVSPERASLSSTRAGALATAPLELVANPRALELTRQAAPEAAKAPEAAQNAAGVTEAPVAPPGPANADDARESAENLAAGALATMGDPARPLEARKRRRRNAREEQGMKNTIEVLKGKVLRSEQDQRRVLQENSRLMCILRENGISLAIETL